jgi:ADP-heptose:LPS heptosyltransferase
VHLIVFIKQIRNGEEYMLNESWHSVHNVLLIRLDNLGDVLLSTPAFHSVRTALPDSHLTLLTSPAGAQVGTLDPDIDTVIVYEAPWMDPWCKLPQNSQREQLLIAQLKEQHFDGAIIFTSFHQSSLPAAYLCYLADIPLRVAASIDGPGSLLTTRHKHPERMMHEVEHGLDLVAALGIISIDNDMVLKVPDSVLASVSQMFITHGTQQDKRPLVVVHPGCSMPARTYPWEMYVEVIDLLVEQLDAFVVVTGSTDEQALVTNVLEGVQAGHQHSILGLAGAFSFPELCALIQIADLTITNNTGPMHIAAALKTPVITLFALTNPPEQWGPWHVPHRLLYHDVPCRICYRRICPYQHECLRLVSPEIVVAAATELLAEVDQPSLVGPIQRSYIPSSFLPQETDS